MESKGALFFTFALFCYLTNNVHCGSQVTTTSDPSANNQKGESLNTSFPTILLSENGKSETRKPNSIAAPHTQDLELQQEISSGRTIGFPWPCLEYLLANFHISEIMICMELVLVISELCYNYWTLSLRFCWSYRTDQNILQVNYDNETLPYDNFFTELDMELMHLD